MAEKDKGPIKGDDAAKGPTRDALDILTSSTYGISPDFLRDNDKLLEETRKTLSDRLTPSTQKTGNTKGSNASQYVSLLTSTMQQEDKMTLLRDLKINESFTNPSGSHQITEDSHVVDKLSDSNIIEEMVAGVRNHFALMPEYNKVCQIIPELDKAIWVIVKDIINRDEFSGTFVKNFYNELDENNKNTIEGKITDLLEEYNFEDKMRRYIRAAEVYGVKPFSVLPQDDVINMINEEIKKNKGLPHGVESLNLASMFSEESYLKPSPIKGVSQAYIKKSLNLLTSTESDDYVRMKADKSIETFTDSIISDDIIDEYSEVCIEELKSSFNTEKISILNGKDGTVKYKEALESYNAFMGKLEEPKHVFSKESSIKKHIKDIIVAFDRSIEVVDHRKTPLYQASKRLKPEGFYKTIDDSKGAIDDFYRVGDGNELEGDDVKKKTFNLDNLEIDITDDFIDPKAYVKSVKNKRAIFTEYEPEHVIPISSGGVHIGYYVMEYERTKGDNFLLLKKDKGSFLDIIRRLGVGEDKALVANSGSSAVDSNNPFSSGAFSPSTIMAPILSGSGNGPNTPYNGGQFGNSGQSDRKSELIRSILIKTIVKRLGDDSLIDNATFQSSLMNLIRDDIMFKNKVRFSFIPESHMVYMSRELDDNGFPLSILDGTLFSCYMYISSLISSLMIKVMKSSDTEVMEVNVGKSRELGLTVGMISQNASTRNVSARTLFGGTDNIVRSVGNFKRLIIPNINGEKLYEVTQIERVNNVDIDDDFTERTLKSIIMKIGVPPTTLDMMSQDEYVASQTQHRIDYRNLIVDRMVNYSKFITKAIKLLVHYSDVTIPTLKLVNTGSADVQQSAGKGVKSEIEIDITKIEFKFPAPKNLTVTKITEELGNISTLAEDIVKMYYGDFSGDSKEWETLVGLTKRLLVKELSTSTDWATIDEVIERARLETPKWFNILKTYNKELVEDEESGEEGGDDYGGGGDTGGDTGGDAGGGDFGGDDTGGDAGGEEGGDAGGDSEGGDDGMDFKF